MPANQMLKLNMISKELDLKSKTLTDILTEAGVTGKSHSATVTDEEFGLLFNKLTSDNQIVGIDAYMAGNVKIKVPEKQSENEEKSAPAGGETSASAPERKTAEVKKEESAVRPAKREEPKGDKKSVKNQQNAKNAPSQDKNSRFQAPAAQNKNQAAKKKQEKQERRDTRPDRPSFGGNPDEPKVVQSTDDTRSSTVGKTRIVDTRTSTVDLSKYDEKLYNTYYTDSVRSYGQSKKRPAKKKPYKADNVKDKDALARQRRHRQEMIANAKKEVLNVVVGDEITVTDLAAQLKINAAQLVKKLMLLGVMAGVNQSIDYDTAYLVAEELGATVSKAVPVSIEEKLIDDSEDSEEKLCTRAPVVCVMGHVDHGKTSLLDAIRHTNVTEGEAGGITQHIGAYRVNIGGKEITFLDTPGHEAFTTMRARGAMATDIAVLVVAADDGIMPQTVEAINHAKAAGVDIIVAINKMDKEGANPDAIKQALTQYDLVPDEWGGDVICVPVSAVKGTGIDDLLENILLVAEMKDLKANPDRRAKGIVIEAKLDKGRGPVATILVQNGTLHSGDVVIAGTAVGRVRAMTDYNGKTVKEAGPSYPVEIIGLSEVPTAGDVFNAVEDEKMARELVEQRKEKAKNEQQSASAKVSLDDLFAQINSGVKELNIIVKADVVGSAEAVKQSLEKLSNDEVKVKIIHTACGGINEGDVMLAAASNAIIVGFNVRPDKSAIDSADRQGVDIRTYRIIYECIDEIQAAMKGMLTPTFREEILGHAEVRQTIRVPSVGTIAGSYVQDGKIARNAMIRVVRDGVVIFEDKISSLKRFKDDAREVAAGYECGVGLEKFNDIREGDILEAYQMVEVEK